MVLILLYLILDLHFIPNPNLNYFNILYTVVSKHDSDGRHMRKNGDLMNRRTKYSLLFDAFAISKTVMEEMFLRSSGSLSSI